MIDLTPLEVRKKKGDFRRAMRGYDPALVDDFLDLVADRMEELVRENLTLNERVGRQDEQVKDYRDRERALTEALVSAQEMREEVRRQAVLEAELAKRTAEQQAEQLRSSAEAEVRQLRSSAQQKASEELATLKQERQQEEQVVRELRARREEFLGNYRAFLEQELEELGVIARAAGASLRQAAQAAPVRAAAADSPSGTVHRSAAPAETSPVQSGDDGSHAARRSAPAAASPAGEPVHPSEPVRDMPESDGDDDIVDDSGFTFDTNAVDIEETDEEPFAPEPFVDDESADVVEAWETESAVQVEGVAGGTTDETEVSGGGVEEKLYDGIAADEDGDGVPGPIGLGAADPWEAAPEWSISDLQLVDDQSDGETLDLDGDGNDDDDDEETQRLLRNAAAAGYDLDDATLTDELLLDEAVADSEAEPEAPVDDGWLPTLLEDDK
ncbi:MAG: DivIVA domain-containing protein [Gemmatimonadetes bacterium]|nr:DivIVA domain-containing protein [Gemmatimonadota bacterium]